MNNFESMNLIKNVHFEKIVATLILPSQGFLFRSSGKTRREQIRLGHILMKFFMPRLIVACNQVAC